MNLENKTILITGANGGVGMATLQYALAHNAKKIYATARDTSALEAFAQTHDNVVVQRLDITNKAQVHQLSQSIEDLDMLINTAGVNSGKRVFDESTIDFHVNVQGTMNVCQALTPKIKQHGAIITITSIVALVNLPIMGLYSASKSALHSLTQALRAELTSKDIEVYEVLAGPIDTKMTEGQEMPKTSPEDIVEAMFTSVAAKEYEIYPDPFAKMVHENFLKDPRAVEAEFAQSVQG
ncbi:MAG: SDR family NAD(P)-dependent oxidoreductase [Sulfurimonas sp.]|jgi:short-subunit dehydrogenase|nr:SDR family NAD(P)-dependent oxidoreductase [Sulfurimonas sp.]